MLEPFYWESDIIRAVFFSPFDIVVDHISQLSDEPSRPSFLHISLLVKERLRVHDGPLDLALLDDLEAVHVVRPVLPVAVLVPDEGLHEPLVERQRVLDQVRRVHPEADVPDEWVVRDPLDGPRTGLDLLGRLGIHDRPEDLLLGGGHPGEVQAVHLVVPVGVQDEDLLAGIAGGLGGRRLAHDLDGPEGAVGLALLDDLTTWLLRPDRLRRGPVREPDELTGLDAGDWHQTHLMTNRCTTKVHGS